MRKKFCPRCGKETEEFIDHVCRDCFLKKFSILKKIPDKIAIKHCGSCEKFYVEDQSAYTSEKVLELFLGKFLKFKEIIDASYRVHVGKLHLTLKIHSDGADKTEGKEIALVEKKIICESCGMKFSGYFNSIIQLRCPEEKLGKIIEEIHQMVKSLNKSDRLSFISNEEETVNGFDFYIGSKAAANKTANELKKRYRAKIKISRKLSGSKGGKSIYRDTLLVSIE